MDTIKAAVYETLQTIAKTDQPAETSLLKEDLGIDSIRLVRIFTRLMGTLKVNIFEFSDQDLARIRTVGDMIRLFTEKQQKA